MRLCVCKRHVLMMWSRQGSDRGSTLEVDGGGAGEFFFSGS